MTKWICDECTICMGGACKCETHTFAPEFCVINKKKQAYWVVDNTDLNTATIESVETEDELPDWCKVGEWKVKDHPHPWDKSDNDIFYEIQWSEDGELVADIIYKKEDAILMSASKEMYEALVDLVGKCRPGWREVNVSGETIEKALKALKKARGEE